VRVCVRGVAGDVRFGMRVGVVWGLVWARIGRLKSVRFQQTGIMIQTYARRGEFQRDVHVDTCPLTLPRRTGRFFSVYRSAPFEDVMRHGLYKTC
jgi:hypothetical protein